MENILWVEIFFSFVEFYSNYPRETLMDFRKATDDNIEYFYELFTPFVIRKQLKSTDILYKLFKEREKISNTNDMARITIRLYYDFIKACHI